MSTATQEKIFEPFFTTKDKDKGTGLGLATVFGIVKQHNGHIYVYSELNQGTTFKIYLPAAQISEKTGQSHAKETIAGGSETILVVEDDNMVRDLAYKVLTGHGYNVLVTETPQQAIELEASYTGKIDLLFTDVVMPGMNGRELYAALAGKRGELKVLFTSGYTDNVITHNGKLDKGVNFLQKPFSVHGLLQSIRRSL